MSNDEHDDLLTYDWYYIYIYRLMMTIGRSTLMFSAYEDSLISYILLDNPYTKLCYYRWLSSQNFVTLADLWMSSTS